VVEPWELALLIAVAGLGGFVDAIAGGGGLLTLPALMVAGLPPHVAMATNKGQSVFGSGGSLTRFAHSPLLDRRRVLPTFAPTVIAAGLGVGAVRLVDPDVLTPLVTVLLTAAAILILLGQRVRATHGPAIERPAWVAAAVGAGAGFYDGFFGPGTGTLLIVAYLLLSCCCGATGRTRPAPTPRSPTSPVTSGRCSSSRQWGWSTGGSPCRWAPRSWLAAGAGRTSRSATGPASSARRRSA